MKRISKHTCILALILVLSIVNSYSFRRLASLSLNTETLLSPSGAVSQRYPASAYTNGVHLVVWQEGNEVWGGDAQIKGLLVGDDGAYGSSFIISNAADVQEQPAVATDGSNFFVVWQDFRNGSDYDIYGARVTPQGSIIDPSGIAIATGSGNQCRPSVSFDGTSFVVVWMDNRVIIQSYQLRGARVSPFGTVLDTDSVYLLGPNDPGALAAIFDTGNMEYVPMLSSPSISCRNHQCIMCYMAKDDGTLAFNEIPRYIRLNTISGITLNGTGVRFGDNTVYSEDSRPFTSETFGGLMIATVRENGQYLLSYSGPNQKGYGHYFVAAFPVNIGDSGPLPGLKVRPDAEGGYIGRVSAAANGNSVFVFWSDFSNLRINPTPYSLYGSIVDASGSVSTATIFNADSSYRGFPAVSVGDTNGFLVYEKDTGAGGIRVAGILFGKSTLPLSPSLPSTFDFSISSGGDKTVAQGGSVSNTISASLLTGTAQAVTFSLGTVSSQITAVLSPVTCTPGCASTVTVTAVNAAPGSYLIPITATSATTSHSTTFSVSVTGTPPPPPPAAPSNPKNLHLPSAPPGTPGNLSVPITIQEALPAGVTGAARIEEPVTVGIPLALDSGITTVNQLGLSGASLGQFRVLARWPNGNIKWILIDTQASLSPGGSAQITLANNGTGNFGGIALAQDNGTTITINTGSATFVVKKANFNGFDSVIVADTTLVSSGNSGGVRARDRNGIVYSSANDTNSTAVIEENGPARTVVKASGSVKSNGVRLLDYTLRLHFYKNKSYVKAIAAIRNASLNYTTNGYFTGFEVVVPLSLESGKTVEYSLASTTTSISLASNDTSYLMQGYNSDSRIFNATDCYNWDPPLLGACSGSTYTFNAGSSVGLDIKHNTTSVNTMGSMNDWTQGYAGLEDATGKGVALSLRWMSSYWPAGFEINGNGEASIELFSKHNTWTEMKLPFRRHEEREILWDFYTDNKDNKNALFELQYPLVARAPLTYYQSSKGMFGQQAIATQAQQEKFFLDMNRSFLPTSPSLANPVVDQIFRWYPWGSGGGGNQTDFALNDLMDFLRTGNTGFYLRGGQRTRFVASVAIPYSDDWFMESVGTVVDTIHPDWPGINGPSYAGSTTYIEHDHVMSIPFYYYLTGDETLKDGFGEYGQWLELHGESYNDIYFRQWARKYRNMALLYQFSCETGVCRSQYNSWVRAATDFMLDSKSESAAAPNTIGRSLTRGYQYWDISMYDTSGHGRVVHSLFHTQIQFEAVYQVLRMMSELDQKYREQDILDYMLGLAHFYLDEYLDNDPDEQPALQLGFMYNYPIDVYVEPVTGLGGSSSLVPYDVSRAGVFLYQHTGDSTYLNKAGTQTVGIAGWATMRSPSELQDQALIYTYANQATTATWNNLTLSVNNNGGGSYTLSWIVPAGATKYQIKYGDKPIVEWLGFNKITRTYSYDPSSCIPFFSAQNLAGDVLPLAPGSRQTITVTLDPGKQWYFAVKCLSGTN